VLLSALYLPHGMLSDLMTLLHMQNYIAENEMHDVHDGIYNECLILDQLRSYSNGTP
jgi:hypothetical protein